MCFSATASFAASGGLAVVGAASWRLAKGKQKLLAIVPLLFAVQQALEGFQWLAAGSGFSSVALGYAFLFFAFLLWPFFIPTAMFILDKKRRTILTWFVGIGIGVSLALLSALLFAPLVVRVFDRSILYQVGVPLHTTLIVAVSVLYLAAVTGPMFVSSRPVFRWMGLLILLSALVAVAFFWTTFISVWCFFAALLSSSIYLYLKFQNNSAVRRSVFS